MIEITTSPGRAEWPIPPQKVRKRRNSRVAYHHTARYFHRNVPLSSTSVSPPRNSASRPSVQVHQEALPGPSSNRGFDNLALWDFQASPVEDSSFEPTAHQNGHNDIAWQSSMISYNYPSISADSPHSPNNNSPAQILDHELAISWDTPLPIRGNNNYDVEIGSPSDTEFEQFGSFDSMDVSNASTMASSISENYVLPASGSGIDLPGGKVQMEDLSLPGTCATFRPKCLAFDIFIAAPHP